MRKTSEAVQEFVYINYPELELHPAALIDSVTTDSNTSIVSSVSSPLKRMPFTWDKMSS